MQKLSNKRNVIKSDLNKIKDLLATTAYDMGDQAKQVLTEKYENVKDKSANIQSSVEEYIAAKPFKSLSIALLCGWLFGLTMLRKKKYYQARKKSGERNGE